MAFFAASPISMTRPICAKTLFSKPRSQSAAEGAEHRDRRAEQHAEGQRPALVLRGQDQEHHEQREAEDRAGGNALRGDLLLERHADVVEAHLARHGLREHLLERRHALAGLKPGAAAPLICAARYWLKRMVNSGPLVGFIVTSADSGTSALALRT